MSRNVIRAPNVKDETCSDSRMCFARAASILAMRKKRCGSLDDSFRHDLNRASNKDYSSLRYVSRVVGRRASGFVLVAKGLPLPADAVGCAPAERRAAPAIIQSDSRGGSSSAASIRSTTAPQFYWGSVLELPSVTATGRWRERGRIGRRDT
jgi:hypothetical protein